MPEVVINDLDCELRQIQRALTMAHASAKDSDERFVQVFADDAARRAILNEHLEEALAIVESLLDVAATDDSSRATV